MEYRIHSNNGIKTSVIGLNFTNFKFFEENYKKQIIGSILEIANKHKLNFISIPSFNDELLRTILEWKKVNNWEPIISIQIGFSAIDYKTMNKLYDKKIIFQNRFENIVEEASKLLDTYQIDKIQFLSLFYPKLDHIKQNDFDAIQKELKKTGIVQSVGIHCQFVSDAILLANRINIDFIELEIDINTSSDIINSLFKICQRNNIAIICLQKETLEVDNNKNDEDLNVLLSLLYSGEQQFLSNFETNQSKAQDNLFHLALRKNLIGNFQTIGIAIFTIEDFDKLKSSLTHAYLSGDEVLQLQNYSLPPIYESPKNRHS